VLVVAPPSTETSIAKGEAVFARRSLVSSPGGTVIVTVSVSLSDVREPP
jgi:hypothetical protein